MQVKFESETLSRVVYWKRIREKWKSVDKSKYPLPFITAWVDNMEIRYDYDESAHRLVASLWNARESYKQHEIGKKLPLYHVYLL